MTRTPIALLAVSAALAASPLAAQETVLVPFGHLDLATEAGQHELNRALETAVDEVCGVRPAYTNLAVQRAHRACETEARESYKVAQRIAVRSAEETARMAMNENTNDAG